MSTITFKALINDIHYDLKKGALKIQLIGASHVSLDKLATLGPHDETVQVTLESAQTRLDDVGDPTVIEEKGAAWLEEAARELVESNEPGDHEETEEKKGKITMDTGASEEGRLG